MHIEPTDAAAAAFFGSPPEGSIVMLNLLKYRKLADYSMFAELAPPSPISGRDAYAIYAKHTLPILREAGGEVIFSGDALPFLVGPADETWDAVLLVRHKSAGVFLSFARNEEYLAGVGHRTAALADSRLLPIVTGE
jgi:uncharacterized protein (DUF1330 family)